MDEIRRVTLSIQEKLSILEEIKTTSKKDISKRYGISLATVSRIARNKNLILRNSQTINPSRKRNRIGKSEKIEKAVSTWFDQMLASGVVVSTSMIMKKTKEFAIALNEDFEPSPGWLYRWQKRKGISLKKIKDEADSTNKYVAKASRETISNEISEYPNEDIFNAGETDLFYKAMPSNSVQKKTNADSPADKSPIERIKLLLVVNATGEYKKIFAFGQGKLPLSLANKSMPIEYFPQDKTYMTQEIWYKIMHGFNEEMFQQNRHVILYLDNPTVQRKLNLSNVNMQYLSSHTTSILKPLDLGIIHKFKDNYREILIEKQKETESATDDFRMSIDILTALRIIKRAFRMVKAETIYNCFEKANLVSQLHDSQDEQYEQDELHEQIVKKEKDEQTDDDLTETVDNFQESEEDFCNSMNGDNDIQCNSLSAYSDNCLEVQLSEYKIESAGDYDENGLIPSASVALEALHQLQLFFLGTNVFSDELSRIREYICNNS